MPKNKCTDNRKTCAQTVMSACVPYTGSDLTSFDVDNLPCNPNINDIIKELDEAIKLLQTGIDVSTVDITCLDNCNCDTNTIAGLFTLVITKLCDALEKIKQLEAVDISQVKFNIDLSCFNNPCFNSSNTEHSLIEILSLLLVEVCTLKNK